MNNNKEKKRGNSYEIITVNDIVPSFEDYDSGR